MAAMRDCSRSYLSSGCDETDAFAAQAKQVLFGQDDPDVVAVPYGTFGRSAITSAIRLLCPKVANDVEQRMVASSCIFPGTWSFLANLFPAYGGEVVFVKDINDAGELISALRGTITKPSARLVMFEITSNPMLVVTDLERVINAVKSRFPNCVIMVDDTVNAGALDTSGQPFSPLRFGADIVAYSLSKHTAAWGDERGGLLLGRNREIDLRVAGSNRLMDILTFAQRLEGTHLHPEVAIRLSERIRDLPERQQQASANAMILAKTLADFQLPVLYPGLTSLPTHQNALANGMCQFGGLVTLDLGNMDTAAEVGDALASAGIIVPSNSFGEERTLAEAMVYCLPQHAGVLAAMGIPQGTLRISCGWGVSSEDMESQAAKAAEIIRNALAA